MPTLSDQERQDLIDSYDEELEVSRVPTPKELFVPNRY
jgi:hypothetical protein